MRQPFQGQPWHSERWRVNSQDSNRKSKAKKPNNRTGGNGWKESAPQTSKPSCTGPAKPRGAGRQRLGCREPCCCRTPRTAACAGQMPCTEPFRRAWLPDRPHVHLWDAQSSQLSLPARGLCGGTGEALCLTWGRASSHLYISTPLSMSLVGNTGSFRGNGGRSVEARQSRDVSELEVLGCPWGR